MGNRLHALCLLLVPGLAGGCAMPERARDGSAVYGARRIVHAEDLRGLTGVTRLLGDLVLERASVPTLKGLSLEAVSGDLVVRANASLESLDGLDRLRSIGGDLLVERNPRLQGFFELASLRRVGGQVRIIENPSLSLCEALALEAQMHLPEDAAIEIRGNDDRPRCSGDLVVDDAAARDPAATL